MTTDLVAAYTLIPAVDLSRDDKVACVDGAPVVSRLALGGAQWKTVNELDLGQTTVHVVFDDGAELTLPYDTVLYVHQPQQD